MSVIVPACDVDNIYKVPGPTFREQGVDDFILEHFGVETPAPDLASWTEPIERAERAGERASGEMGEQGGGDMGGRLPNTVRIAIVGKYVQLEDAYLSVSEGAAPRRPHRAGRARADRVGGLRTVGGRGYPQPRGSRARSRAVEWGSTAS